MTADFIRKSAGTLMLLTGAGHVALLAMRPMSPELAITAAFGVAYFLIGVFLWRGDGRRALWAGLILPAIGAALSFAANASGKGGWTPIGTAFVVIDIVVVLACLWLLMRRAG
ncbi:hypothetical protein [Sphingosinicella microcystinivorans]|uniref:Uncharacterized protein n=1 Tax=Sphingosinicella microcystinivorans TaxID=335406 RepID=A0AAD1G1K7_SPHMI|nr:hypothetical protein [Sphingosinicella microcystinivorans]RKS91858.1 hypothetical protein DFR51_1431 [Sphingosinicella microcystinivorans]BBE34844.1 hypothetical protein SmB9_25020 [Sphingosinicella microcystinivorans]